MTARTGFILDPIVASAGLPGVNVMRCTYSGALGSGDVITFGDVGGNLQRILPQGAILLDAQVTATDAGTLLGVSAGYAAADGAAGTTNSVADVNATYFMGATSLTSGVKARATGGLPLTLQRPTNPTITVTSGAVGSEAKIEFDIFYQYVGNTGQTVVY